jgi:hypothetical protein
MNTTENTLTVSQFQKDTIMHCKGEDSYNTALNELFKKTEIKDNSFIINSGFIRYTVPGMKSRLALNRMLIIVQDESNTRYFKCEVSGNNTDTIIVAKTDFKEQKEEHFLSMLSHELKKQFKVELDNIIQ